MVHMSKVLKVYSVYRGPLTLQEGRLPAFHLVGLVVHQSEEAALLTFQDLTNYKGSCRQDAQPTPILKN